jgi:cyanophycinase
MVVKSHVSAIVFVMLAALPSLAATSAGPAKGNLLIVGGGAIVPEISDQFFELAGGKDAPIVVIPTADGAEKYDDTYLDKTWLRKAGATHLTLLHTNDRATADSADFVKPIAEARGVWFVGGRQWHLVDSYLNTRTQKELVKLLDRGGVIAGSSAGATIIGSYLVRGAREGNALMMAPGYEEGMGFLSNAAVDQHIITRHRESDMGGVIKAHPDLLGIGIDESTAIVVHGSGFFVIGNSKVAITEGGKPYYFLDHGDRFDLKTRSKANP